MKPMAGVISCAYQVPEQVRTNNDTIFAGLAHEGATDQDSRALFPGVIHRRVLADGESLEDLAVRAAEEALRLADVSPGRVDRLYGYLSVSEYLTPNSLHEIHHRLHLPAQAAVIPINNEFSTFLTALTLAGEAITCGSIRHALVVCGSNWSRHVDYTKGHAFCVGDAAAAAVLGPNGRLAIVDQETENHTDRYRAFTLKTRPGASPNVPLYNMDGAGVRAFHTLLRDGLPDLVLRLLQRHCISGNEISLITHQASKDLLDHWSNRIRPAAHLETLGSLGNMTLATYPVNLAHFFADIQTPYVVLAAIGTGSHISCLLLADRARAPSHSQASAAG